MLQSRHPEGLRRWLVWMTAISAGATFLLLGQQVFLPLASRATFAVTPPGTVLTVRIIHPLNSQNARPGDWFEAWVISTNPVEGAAAIPPGSKVEGRCVAVRGAEGRDRPGYLRLTLSGLRDAEGQLSPIDTTTLSQWGGKRIEFGSTSGALTWPQETLPPRAPMSSGAAADDSSEAVIPAETPLTFVLLMPAVLAVRGQNSLSSRISPGANPALTNVAPADLKD